MTRSTSKRWTAVVLVGALAIGSGCGSGSDSTIPPGEAADTLAQNLGLSDEQTACMRSQFERASGATAVLDTDAAPSDADRDRFLGAIRQCLPPEDLGVTLAATVRIELPEATEAQATCVHDNVVALSAPEQDRLYLYFSNPATLDVADVGPAGADLFASCELDVTIEDELAPDTVDPAAPTTPTTGATAAG